MLMQSFISSQLENHGLVGFVFLSFSFVCVFFALFCFLRNVQTSYLLPFLHLFLLPLLQSDEI